MSIDLHSAILDRLSDGMGGLLQHLQPCTYCMQCNYYSSQNETNPRCSLSGSLLSPQVQQQLKAARAVVKAELAIPSWLSASSLSHSCASKNVS